MAGFLELLSLLHDKYPNYYKLINEDGVGAVLIRMMDAEKNGAPWSDAQLQANLGETPYYQTHNAQQRAWDQLSIVDPPSAAAKLTNTQQAIDDLQTQLGINMDKTGGLGSQYVQFINQAVTQGWTADQIKYHMIATANPQSTNNLGGDLGSAATDIKKQFDDYGVPISDQAVMGWANKLVSGAVDASAITGYAQETAKSLFPGLADAISRGVTVRQYADPYLQIANQELGTDTSNVSLTDPKWMRAINSIDPKTGARVSLSLNDWTSVVRSDPTYGYDQTKQATTQAASFATQLAQKMGAT